MTKMRIIVSLVCWFVIAYFYNIKPDYEYTWWWAMLWHGPMMVYNWIISLFDADKLCKAPLHTTAYNVWWWLSSIGSVIWFVSQIIILGVSLFFSKKS